MFADDTKVWNTVTSGSYSRDLQEGLDELEAWSAKCLLNFNFDKCHAMHVGHSVNSKYYIHREGVKTELTVSNMERDLGIWVSDDLKWSNQCSKSAAKVMSILEMITRTFPYLDKEGFTLLYNTYVRPHLECRVQVWTPYNAKDIHALKRFKRERPRWYLV